jgi:hypothetical protein
MDPDNGLYDAACDLVSAAQWADRAVRRDGVEPAIAATLRCVHSTLVALTSACAALSSNDPPGRNGPSRISYLCYAEPPRRARLRERVTPNWACRDLQTRPKPVP